MAKTENTNEMVDFDDWCECWNCGGNGRVAGCFEDTCCCTGDPEEPDYCCAPTKCDVCRGHGGWRVRYGVADV